jgi:HK97 gp10 family phage protein
MMTFGWMRTMADGVSFELSGVDELNAKLKGLSNDLKYKGGRFALRKAANLVRDAAIAGAASVDDSTTPEDIGKNIVVRWSSRRFKSTGDLAFRVGVLGGARQTSKAYQDIGIYKGKGKANPGGDTFYWRFLEFGTEHSQARPFIRRALSENVEKATREFMSQYDKTIDRYLARAAKGK